MDEYFQQYGSTLVENLENLLSPESELKGEVDAFTLNSIRLYPQQAAMVNGVTTHLLNGATFSIICEGMAQERQRRLLQSAKAILCRRKCDAAIEHSRIFIWMSPW